MPASSNNKQHSLPPVGKHRPPQRSLQYIVPHPTNQDTNHHTLPRTNSLPPAYNDLFGIETVPCTQSQSFNSSSPQPPAQAPPNNRHESDLPAIKFSPEEQLQHLLLQMLPQSQPVNPAARNKAQRIPSKPAKPPTYATSADNNHLPANPGSNSNKSSAEWDDQRAQDLFLQLCRL
ncbi:hypothetical protein V7S43_000964 [Phytophthora oleae]|uniref:Uncharacterized protein n=1 Tax=Phytophthora oleae TaxID=2107226 RepID=A0ABD3G2C0_9STRA